MVTSFSFNINHKAIRKNICDIELVIMVFSNDFPTFGENGIVSLLLRARIRNRIGT